MARSYTAHSANAVPNEGWHYFIIPHRTFYPCFYTADSTNVVQNEGRRYLIIPHRTFTEVTSVARSYTADSAHAVPNEGWHYLIKPHRALYPGYISGKILHCRLSKCGSKQRVALPHYTTPGTLPRLYQWQDLTLLTANVVPNEGWHYLTVPHRALYPGYMERSYTADSAHVVPNEGWHYLTVPHRALYPGYYLSLIHI